MLIWFCGEKQFPLPSKRDEMREKGRETRDLSREERRFGLEIIAVEGSRMAYRTLLGVSPGQV